MDHEIVTPTFNRVDERGTFIEALNSGRWECLIYGRMKKHFTMGNHYHKKTEVFFFVTEGKAKIATVHVESGKRDQFTLAENCGVILKTWESHSIRFLEDSGFIMLKSLRFNADDPDTFPLTVEQSD